MAKTGSARRRRPGCRRRLAVRPLCLFCLSVLIVGSALLPFSSLGLATDTISPPTEEEVRQWLEKRGERYISLGSYGGGGESFKVIEKIEMHRLDYQISKETVEEYGTRSAEWWLFVIFQDGKRKAGLTIGRWGWQGEIPIDKPMFATCKAAERRDDGYESPGDRLSDGSECESLEQAFSDLRIFADKIIEQEGLTPGWPVVRLGSKDKHGGK